MSGNALQRLHLSTPIVRHSLEFDDPLDRRQLEAPMQVLFAQPHLPGSPQPLIRVSPSLLLQCCQRKSSKIVQFEPPRTPSTVIVHTKPSSAANRCHDEGSRLTSMIQDNEKSHIVLQEGKNNTTIPNKKLGKKTWQQTIRSHEHGAWDEGKLNKEWV